MRLPALVMLVVLGMSPAAFGVTPGLQEVRIRWDTHARAPAPGVAPDAAAAADVFTLLQQRRQSGSLPRHRNPELSAGQIVVVAVNSRGERVDAQVVPDPRVLRAEGAGPGGMISGETLYHPSTELLLTLPDDPAIRELRIYHPRWVGSAFVLDLLGTIPLP